MPENIVAERLLVWTVLTSFESGTASSPSSSKTGLQAVAIIEVVDIDSSKVAFIPHFLSDQALVTVSRSKHITKWVVTGRTLRCRVLVLSAVQPSATYDFNTYEVAQ